MRTGLLALGIAAGIAACDPALAQSQGVPAVSNKREFRLSGTLDVTYDSNIAHSSEAAAVLRGIQPEDEVFRPSALIEIVQPIGRNAAFLEGTAGYDFHRENKRLDHENIDLTGGGLLSTGPCRTTGYGRYLAAQSDLQDTSLSVVTNLMQTATGGGQIACQRRAFSIQVQGSHTDVVNSQSRQKVADHRGDEVGAQVGYTNQRLGTLGLVLNYGEQSYPSRLNSSGQFGTSYWNELLGINYSRQFGNKIKVQATAGKSTIKRDSAPAGVPLKQSGLNYTVAADYRMTQRLDFTLQAARNFQPSNRPGKLYDLITHTEGAAAYDFGKRITVTVGGFVEDLKANTDTSADSLPTVTKSRRTSEYLSLRYRQSERLSALLDVRHEERVADLAVFTYSDTRATLTLAASF